jgi:hypothetical protein
MVDSWTGASCQAPPRVLRASTAVASVLMVTSGWVAGRCDGVGWELDREAAEVGLRTAVAATERSVQDAFEAELLVQHGEPVTANRTARQAAMVRLRFVLGQGPGGR